MDKKPENNIPSDAHIWQTVKSKDITLSKNYKFFPSNLLVRFASKIALIFCLITIMVYGKIFLGYRVLNRKNFYKVKGGCFIASTHSHPIDAFALAISYYPHRFYVTSLKSNLGWPFGLGKVIRLLGAIPLPDTKDGMVRFIQESKKQIAQGHRIVVFPEGSLWPYNDYVRPFKKGVFRMACDSNSPILPMVWTFHKPKYLRKLICQKKPCVHLHILEPYYLPTIGSKAEIIDQAMNDVHKIMSDFFEKHNEYKKAQ